jgi:hypothetical protein
VVKCPQRQFLDDWSSLWALAVVSSRQLAPSPASDHAGLQGTEMLRVDPRGKVLLRDGDTVLGTHKFLIQGRWSMRRRSVRVWACRTRRRTPGTR